MSKQWYTCNKCGKKLSSYHSLWRHKKRCNVNNSENVTSKRESVDNASYKQNPKFQAFVDGVINSTPKSAVIQKEDDLSTVTDDVFQMLEDVNGKPLRPKRTTSVDDEAKRENKLPSQTSGVVDDIINSLQSGSNSEDDEDVSPTRGKLPQKRKLPSPTPSLIDDVLKEGFRKKSKIEDNGDNDSSTSASSE